MEYTDGNYYTYLACTYALGYTRSDISDSTATLKSVISQTGTNINEYSENEIKSVMTAAEECGLKMYYFKRTHGDILRVKRVLGLMQGLSFETLLDIGSGRGAFLIPFLDCYPDITVMSVDVLDYRVKLYQTLRLGGLNTVNSVQADITSEPFYAQSYDVVTMLEVLEHIPDVQAAVNSAVKTAKKYIIVSVPSHKDDNPEHIHLLTKNRLTELFNNAGCTHLKFDGVSGHIIMLGVK